MRDLFLFEKLGALNDLPYLIEWVLPLAVLLVLSLSALAGYRTLYRFSIRIASRTPYRIDTLLVDYLYGPGRLMTLLLALSISVQLFSETSLIYLGMLHGVKILWIVAAAWLIIRLITILGEVLLSRRDLADQSNVRARAVQTQFKVFQRIVSLMIIILAIGGIFMTFETFRHVGTSIFASAGIAGIILGFSAQKTLGTLFAGIQIAFTQPIRLDDVVIVEGEWGTIEEITLTYAVVKIWDKRRLVLPITYFLEQPFENWTRQGTDLLGPVYLSMDYTVPVDEVRKELDRICREEAGDLWDGDVCGLLVTDANERVVTLRALVSAADSTKAWFLRCLVREKLLGFLQREYPDSLPKLRLESFPSN
ncbi:MAG: mechanosensitive ion channel family protein [Desulfovibrionales bacterium]